ncbi:MAG: glucose 1-dehydrogenase [Phycisphaeraceae bacterium]|nr:glucose 1-dehydrogenase [Phycisphaeraceae bacterium]
MKAIAVNPTQRTVRLVGHADPGDPGSGQVRLKMRRVGICGTDREIAHFEYGTPPERGGYLILGHEGLAEIEAVGEAVSKMKPGDLVVPMVRRPCSHEKCRSCRAGRQDFCFTGDFVECGIKGAHGFMAEAGLDEPAYLVPVPASLAEFGVLVEPLSIAEKALEQVWQVQQRLPWSCDPREDRQRAWCHRAVVLGAGPIGLLGAMAMVAAGFETFVYSREPADSSRAELVRRFDARYISSTDVPIEALAEQLGEIDVVYEATGASSLAFAAVERLGINGVFVLTGVPAEKAPEAVESARIMRRLVLQNQVIFGTVNAGRGAHERAVEDLRRFADRWPDALRGLITTRIGLEQVPDALAAPGQGIKTVIEIAA